MGVDIPKNSSGRAIELKQKQAITHVAPMFDNLRKSKKQITYLLWGKRGKAGVIPQHYNADKVYRIEGEFIRVNQAIKNLKNIENYDILKKISSKLIFKEMFMKSEKEWIKDKDVMERKSKDSIFIDLFHQPRYALSLVKALNPNIKISEEDIEFVTLHSVLMVKPYNDLGLLVNDKLLICMEAQSTWSYNILVRMFMYLGETYHKYIQNHKEMNLYGSKKIEIPSPECYVIYTGKGNYPKELSLAKEFFNNKTALDLKIKVLSTEGKSNIIEEYVGFCHVLDEQIRLYGQTRKAIEETIRICQSENVLKEYLEERAKEVRTIMSILFSQEEVTERYGYERFLEGQNEASENIALNLLRKKMNVNEIAECTQLPPARIKELATTL